jgi:hypothetical protein
MTTNHTAQEASYPTETLIIIRSTSAGTWQVLLGFGGDTENPLCCASFATLAVARAAAPGDRLAVYGRRARAAPTMPAHILGLARRQGVPARRRAGVALAGLRTCPDGGAHPFTMPGSLKIVRQDVDGLNFQMTAADATGCRLVETTASGSYGRTSLLTPHRSVKVPACPVRFLAPVASHRAC